MGFLKENNEEQESILVVINGELSSLTIDEGIIEDIEEENQKKMKKDWVDNFTYSLKMTFIESINNTITEKWNQATTINNVNFVKILNKI